MEILRCAVTRNPCGSDTWMVGKPCLCLPCQLYVARRQRDAAGAALREAINVEVLACTGGERCARHDRWRAALGEPAPPAAAPTPEEG